MDSSCPVRESRPRALARVGLAELDPDLLGNNLGVGQKQLVEIAAGISQTWKVLILDEPTAALTTADAERLFSQVRKLKESGVGIIFISHHLDEILELADRVSVLRDGEMVSTRNRGQITIDEMIRSMVGRTVEQRVAVAKRRISGIPIPQVQNPRPIKIAVFIISGALSGVAAIAYCARLASVDPNAGSGFELEATAAVVIGGTSLMGGRGSVINSLFGVLVISVLETGLAQLGAQEPVKRLVTGGVIVAAVIVDFYRTRRAEAKSRAING